MNPAPHATHDATGQYRYVVVGNEEVNTFPYAVVCPDGTEHSRQNLRAVADQIADRLNTEDRRNRAMTDSDRLAAIRAIFAEVESNPDPSEDDIETNALWSIYDITLAEQPAPEPIAFDNPQDLADYWRNHPDSLVIALRSVWNAALELLDEDEDAPVTGRSPR